MMSNGMQQVLARPRLLVGIRVLVAVVGGYALAAGISLLFKHYSELEGRELRALVYLVFLLCYPVIIIGLFAINSHRQAMLSVIAANTVVWGLLWSLGGWT